jgi:hypothetical protein
MPKAIELLNTFRDALIERFERTGKTRAEAVALINANKPLFFAEFQKALDKATKPNVTVH